MPLELRLESMLVSMEARLGGQEGTLGGPVEATTAALAEIEINSTLHRTLEQGGVPASHGQLSVGPACPH